MIKKLLVLCSSWLGPFIGAALLLLWMITRPAIRFMSAVLMIAAIFTLTADVTRWQVGDTDPVFHSLTYHINSASPTMFNSMSNTVASALHPTVWDYGVLIVLSLPAWLTFTFIGFALAFVGREQRQRINVYAT